MKAIASFAQKHPVIASGLWAVVAAVICLTQRSLWLHNDDMQIYFMLMNGGCADGALGYGLYTNYILGWLISQLSILLPQLNIYLVLLFVLALAACWCVNFVVLEAQSKRWGESGKLGRVAIFASWLVLLVVNEACLFKTQYTYVGVWSAISGVLLLSSIDKEGAWLKRSCVAACLLLAAFALRESSVVPAIFIGAVALLKHWRNKKVILVCVGIAVLMGGLHALDAWAYKNQPQWNVARQFSAMRVKIVDSPDNSGIDKSSQLQAAGVSPEHFSLFRSFVYTPSMADLAQLEKCLPVHQYGRKGLFDSQFLADKGLLNGSVLKQFDKGPSIFFIVTPWVPLLLMSMLYVIGMQKRTLLPAAGMVCAIVFYICVLLMLQRMVDRVLNPVLYAGAVWMMLLPPRKTRFTESWLVCGASAAFCLCCVLFFIRHWNIFPREEGAAHYCAAHPQNLFLTTVQQGLGLYPLGFAGYSQQWLCQTNLLPIADGWSFYTPAYQAALETRGFKSIEEAFFHPSTVIITHKPSHVGALSMLARLAACEWNKKIEFSVVDECGEFYFVKVIQK